VVVGTVASVLIARTAAVRTATISTALRHYENALQAARSLWIASEEVSREEFRAFANALELTHRYPGLQSIGWREVVVVADAADFVRQARAGGATGFTIRPPCSAPSSGSTPGPSRASWPTWSGPVRPARPSSPARPPWWTSCRCRGHAARWPSS
jgi:hypothetical protein